MLIPLLIVFVPLTILAVLSLWLGNVKAKIKDAPRTHCSVCGTASVKVDDQYCSDECKEKLAKSMDDWHDRFEEMDK